jgi:hypothetical protein
LERVQAASGDLEMRIAELEASDARVQDLLRRVRQFLADMRDVAAAQAREPTGPAHGRDAANPDASEAVPLRRA